MEQQPKIVMQAHAPDDDPFAAIGEVDTGAKKLVSPLEFGSGAVSSPLAQKDDAEPKGNADDPAAKKDKDEPSASSSE